LELEWLYEGAIIDSIVDVPDDQGGWVRIYLARSGYDVAGEPSYPIASYNIWQRIDDLSVARMISDSGSRHVDFGELGSQRAFDEAVDAREDYHSVIEWRGRYFVRSSHKLASTGFPPGTWELVGSFAAAQQDQYINRTPTVADSSTAGTAYSVYVISAHTTTPSVWFTSEPDSGYSVDNIAPGVPLGLSVAYNTGSGNTLDWNDSPEEDFQYYRVYRGDDEEFIPGPGTLVHETAVSGWIDPEYDGWDVHYNVTALDHAGNESDPAGAGTVTGGDTPQTPASYALYQNVPNPFNPMTTIRFDLPRAAHVTVSVYNIKGEHVASVVDGDMTAGRKEVVWTAVNGRGDAVASGIYFYRLVVGDYVQTRKMVLLR
jgi:hypothetical protein